MIIFGWGGGEVKKYGPTVKRKCEHCGNDEPWILVKSNKRITLYFATVAPYATKRMLLCPVCNYGISISSEQFDQLLPLAIANQNLIDSKVTLEQDKIFNLIDSKLANEGHASHPSQTILPSEAPKCSDCGAERGTGSYCSSCGHKFPVTTKKNDGVETHWL